MAVDLFSIGRSSLGASKKSLQTTSHNIANANTEGYSRQRITTKTNVPIGEGHHVFGTGVNIQSVKRVHDELVQKKLNHSLTDHAHHEERTYQLSRIEEIFNEVNSEGMNKILNRFFNSFRELANQPENETVRAIVRDNASLVVKDFHRVNEALREVKTSIDSKITKSIDDINSLSKSIADLNNEIIRLEVAGGETGDLRDQRDLAVEELAKFFEIKTYQNEKGQYVVNVEGAGSLVSGSVYSEVKSGIRNGERGSKGEGQVEIFFDGKPGYPISDNLKTGTLGAQLKTRNVDVKEMREELNKVAVGLTQATNAIHRRGFINGNIPISANGEPIANGKKITGINFFKDPLDPHMAAEYIDLSDDVKNDLNNIATGLEPNSPGDNRIAIAVSKLQHEKVLSEQTTTFEEAYLQSVGKVGLRTGKSKLDEEQALGILAQAKSIKERISGVSLDEEAANLVKYQHAYEASARVLRTADEMFDSVLDMMR